MKKIILCALFFYLFSLTLTAQMKVRKPQAFKTTWKNIWDNDSAVKKNIIKFNPLLMNILGVDLYYERRLSKSFSVELNAMHNIPIHDGASLWTIFDINVGVRFYFVPQKYFLNGLYISPVYGYKESKIKSPDKTEYDVKTPQFGIILGYQHIFILGLKQRITLDIGLGIKNRLHQTYSAKFPSGQALYGPTCYASLGYMF